MDGLANGVRIEPPQRVAVRLGDGEDAVEAGECLSLVSQHPPVLQRVQKTADRARLRFRVAAPDLGLDVVREHHRRAGQRLRQVDRGKQEIAHDQIEGAPVQHLAKAALEGARSVLADRVRKGTQQVLRHVDEEAP